jgi:hypothetical protein
MVRKIFFAVIATALASATFAQNNSEDVLYLKSGGVIRGKIVDQLSTGKVKIELPGGSVFVFATAEIDSIRKENALRNSRKEIQRNYYRKDRGFRNMTELAIIYGVNFKNNPSNYNYNNGDDIGLSLQTINGYQFWPYLFVGGGIGIDRFITYQQTFSPFFIRLSTEFLKRKVTPYIYTDAGYSVMWKEPVSDGGGYTKNTGGAYFAMGGGVRIYTRSQASVILSAGYKMNMSSSTYNDGYSVDYSSISRVYQRFVMNIGVSF